MRIIDEAEIRAAVKEPEALASAEKAFRALAEGRVELPPPMGLEVPEAQGEVHVKSAYLKGSPIFAVKIASGFYGNVERGLPSGSGLILVFDATTGFPAVLLADNGYLTDLRTAAAGALAARLLAPESLGTVGMLGSGTQGRFQLRALSHVRRWERTVAWSPNADRLARYCSEMEEELGIPISTAAHPEDAVRGVDLLITATPSREPLFDASALQPHATVIAVGSDGPDKRELTTGALARAGKIVVDRLSQCMSLGEVHHGVEEGAITPDSVHAELGEVLTGAKAGREADELIICDLTGVGAQDAAIAEVTWEKLCSR
ncbi:MAG: ornithine cyclodeaminase family protein [Gemmatimonadota bacterium]|nr:MAG: ornithine cyclodeaminase family protein [Gemmatimonadota bacterium]